MLPIILATIFLIASWIFFYKSERVKVSLTLETSNTKRTVPIYERLHRNGARFHLSKNGTYCGKDELRPYKRPTKDDFATDDEVAIFFDIIPLGSVVYCLLWSLKGKIEELDLLIPVHEGVRGGAFAPRATWVRDLDGDNSPANVWERICNRLFPKCLRWPITLPVNLKESDSPGGEPNVYKLSLFADFEKIRTWHFCRSFFNMLAFSSVLVAAFQLWAPDVYGWLVLNSIPLPEWSRSYVGCVALILLLLAAFFSLRLFIRPTATNARAFLRGGKLYVVTFWTLFFSSWMLVIFSPGTALWFAILGLSAGGAVAPFLLETWWFRKRIESEKSFWISDMVMDSFLALGPIAS